MEGVNPSAGFLPVVVQIPVFFALYKVLFVTIEMRHAPFYGWIDDLSAPDPLSLLNLFGLIDWSVPPILQVVNIGLRSEEHTSELQSLMRISYAVFCLKKKTSTHKSDKTKTTVSNKVT